MTTTAKSSSWRTERLATPKSLPAAFHEDRRSVYWDNGIPPKDYSKTTVFVMTSRQDELAAYRKPHPQYTPSRSSPVWSVSEQALSATASERVSQLAVAKRLHPDYWPPKGVMTMIPRPALQATPTSRLSELARHKSYAPLKIKQQSEWDWGQWQSDINPAALSAIATERVCSLAEPKKVPETYAGPRPVIWDVGKAAQNHIATDRTSKLARPKNKHEDTADYDPYTYVVSRSALIAQPSPRINELAVPLPRKTRTKK